MILKKFEKSGKINGDNASNGTNVDLLQNVNGASKETEDEDDLNIDSSNLTKPFCIYR